MRPGGGERAMADQPACRQSEKSQQQGLHHDQCKNLARVRAERAQHGQVAATALGGLVDLDPLLITHVDEVSPIWSPQPGDVVVMKLSNRQVTVRRVVDGQYVVEYVDRSVATVDIQDIERLKI